MSKRDDVFGGFLPAECAICGGVAPNSSTGLGGISWRGLALDGRVHARPDYGMRIAACRGCGYCAQDLSAAPADVQVIVRSADYARQLADPTRPPAANQFLCVTMIALMRADLDVAFRAALQAAWICDDVAPAAATGCRAYALELAGLHGRVDPGVVADIARRAGRFDEVERICVAAIPQATDARARRALEFERRLASQRDMDAHTLEDDFLGEPPVPELRMTAIDGREIALADFRGAPVVIFFQAELCPKAVPPDTVRRAAEAVTADGAAFVAVFAHHLDKLAAVRAFRDAHGLPYPCVWDDAVALARSRRTGIAHHFGVEKVNTAVVLDAAGRLADRGTIASLPAALEAAREGRRGPGFGQGDGSAL